MRSWRLPLALLLALTLMGGHLAVLQAVAWGGMVAQRSASQGWSGALRSTLAGEDPCAMCLSVRSLAQGGDGVAWAGTGAPEAPATPIPAARKWDALVPTPEIPAPGPAADGCWSAIQVLWPAPPVLAVRRPPPCAV